MPFQYRKLLLLSVSRYPFLSEILFRNEPIPYIVDMQKDFLLPGGFGEIQGANLERVQKTIAPTLAVLQLARQVKLPVIHTREGNPTL
jgi:hypothetical protein